MARRSVTPARYSDEIKEQVIKKAMEGVWGKKLEACFPDIPRTTIATWVSGLTPPKKRELKPRYAALLSLPGEVKEAKVIEPEEALNFFSYKIDYDQAMREVDRVRAWMQTALVVVAEENEDPGTRIKAMTVLRQVLLDRECSLVREHKRIEQVAPTEDDVAGLLKYLEETRGFRSPEQDDSGAEE